MFERIPNDRTNVHFSNNLSFNQEFNIYTYRNFYNGGGVGLGDVNNDGLIDIYFTSNQGQNKLYLNKGDFLFEDITEKAGVGGTKAWSTGVAMVDVNGDGLMDIYVCNSGDIEGDNKQNELFINKGNLTFEESAEQYGLDERGFTTHAAFFDYDKDGDLDAYILNNSYQSIGSFNLRKNERPKRDSLGGDKLLRNDKGFFVDVSEQAGIYGSVIGFGLGITLGDVNQDGWLDIYVSNDFFERDYLYVNNGNGTFKETLTDYMGSISAASMGADLADLNNDGWPELFVTEMLPYEYSRIKSVTTFEDWNRYQYNLSNDYYHQFTRNTLQLNNAGKSFSEIGRLAGVEATDWSWGALLFDMDNDGLRDIFVSNGIRQDLTNQDFLQYASSEEFVESVVSKGSINYKKLVEVIPSYPVPNFAFRNEGNLLFENVSSSWGFDQPDFSNGSAYGDLDNDGDLDLVINHIDEEASIYRNNARELFSNAYLKIDLKGDSMNSLGVGAKVCIYKDTVNWSAEQIITKGFQSSVDPRLNFGLGQINAVDSIEVIWPSNKKSVMRNVKVNQAVKFLERDAKPYQTLKRAKNSPTLKSTGTSVVHVDVENDFNDFDRDRLLYHMISNEGPRMCQGDVNGDKLSDFYIGGSQGESGSLYVQERSGGFRKISAAIFEVDKVSEDCGCAFFDMDNDGDDDLYVTSGSNELPNSSSALLDRLYVNAGGGRFTKSNQLLPTSNFESTSVVKPSDFDGDGDMDLFVGVRVQPFVYGVPVNGYLLENNGRGNFTEVSSSRAPELRSLGMITDAVWSDVEGDGDDDLLVVGEWMQIRLLINSGGVFKDVSDTYGLLHTSGWWNRIVSRDLDGDGDDDYVVGNHGLNSRFKASVEKPISMWVNDFDQNGTVEQIICRWWGDRQYPLALRHDLVSQLPGLKKKYLKYESFKDQGMEEIFSAEELKGSLKWEAEELRSMVIYNEGDHFRLEALPIEAQLSPVYGIAVSDYDGDGNEDIVLGGNQYRSKPEVGRYDASYGVYLKGDGNGGFKNLPAEQSGIWIRGEVRDMLTIKSRKENLLLISVNSDSLKIYKY
ncbi:MAG TPA: VCBS repeat-containing protein [Cyclobacteriaceae bacterium]|nr:VCBS repeat-containing protein [Cyclobacteriaceae bacterium]